MAFFKKILNNFKNVLDLDLEVENFSQEKISYSEEDLERKFQEGYSAAKKELEAKKALEAKREKERLIELENKKKEEELERKKRREEREREDRNWERERQMKKEEREILF